MDEFKILLGTELDESSLNSISSKLKNIKVDPIKIKLDTSDVQKQIASIKSQIKDLSSNQKITINPSVSSISVNSNNRIKSNIPGADSSNIERINLAYKEMKQNLAEIGRLQVDSLRLSFKGGSENELNSVNARLEELKENYKKLKAEFEGGFSETQLGNLALEAEKADVKVERFSQRIADLKTAIGTNTGFGEFDSQLSNLTTKYVKLSDEGKKLVTSLDGAKQSLSGMKSAFDSGDIDKAIDHWKKYKEQVEQTQNQLKQAANVDRQASSMQGLASQKQMFSLKMDAWLQTNSKAADTFGYKIDELKERLRSCDGIQLKGIQQEFKELDAEAEKAGLKTTSFFGDLKEKARELSSYYSAATLMGGATQIVKSMYDQVKSIDSAMTELKKVTDETDSSYDNFLGSASKSAKEIGATVDGFVTSTGDFARLGYSFDDSQNLAKVANIYATVGDEISSVDDATQSVISTMKAFGIEADNAISIVDKYNEIGNRFAISSGGIGDAMQRSASALKTAGNDIDESIAMIASANEIIQDPEQVGNGMKTIALRLIGNKDELEKLGEETDNVAESTDALNKKMKETAGISITDTNGELKSTYKILDELSEKWGSLSSLQQAELTDTLAGKNRANVFAALMQNWDKAREAFDVSANQSAGSAEKEMSKALDSIEAKVNQLKATGQSISMDFLDSDSLKQTLDIIIKLGSALDTVIQKVGALPTLVGAVTAAFSAIGDKGLVKRDSLKSLFTGSFGNKEKGIITDSFSASLNSDISAINSFNEAIANGQGRSQAFESCLASASNSAKEYAKSIADGALSSETFSKNMVSSQVAMKAAGTAQGNLINRIRSAKSIVTEYNNECKNTGMSQKDFVSAVGQGSSTWGKYLSGLNGAKASLLGYCGYLAKTQAATIALNVATAALNTAITMGVTYIISKLINAVQQTELRMESAKEKTVEFGETISENVKQLEEAYIAAKKYAGTEQASEANKTLENVILSSCSALGIQVTAFDNAKNSADEYIKKILEANALGQKEAASATEDELKTEINKGFENKFSFMAYSGKFNLFKGIDIDQKQLDYAKKLLGDNGIDYYQTDAGIGLKLNDGKNYDNINDLIKDYYALDKAKKQAIKEDKMETDVYKALNIVTSETKDTIDQYTESQYKYLESQYMVENGIPSTAEEYKKFGEYIKQNTGFCQEFQDAVMNMAAIDFGTDIFSTSDIQGATKATQDQIKALRDGFKEQGESSLSWFNSLSAGDKQLVYKISAETDDTSLWDLTKWEEELNHLKETGETTSESLSSFYDVMSNSDDGNFKSQIENSVDAITSLQDSLDKLDLGELSDSDLANLAMNYPQLAPYINDTDALRDSLENLIDDTKSGLDDSFQSQIEELGGESTAAGQAMLELQKAIQAINDTPFDISKETQGIENYKTAVNESVTATGLSEDSIKKIQARYRSLDGYNPNKLFERTVNGIHLNVSALRELESEYKTQKKTDLTSQIESMSEEYARLYKAMKNCTDTSKTIEYSKQLQELSEQIDSVSQLAAEYDGLTSSYNEWLNAQSTTDEDDMFSKISNGIENMQEQYDLGRVGTDDFRSWVQMMTNADMATASIADLEAMYEKGTSTIQRFFTDDRSGLENFVNDVKAISDELGKNWVNIDKDGNYHIDFGIGGDEEVANMLTEMDNLQISTQQVQILMRALSAYGFDINLDSLNTSVSLLESANEKLKSLGKTSVTFDINTTDIDNVNEQIKEAQSVFDSFKNDDGTININADGAKEAETVLSALITRKQELANPVVMAIDTSQLNDLSLSTQMTNLRMLLQDSNDYELNVSLGIDTSGLESKIQSIIPMLQTMPTEMKAKLGLDDADFQQALANIQNTKLDVGAEVNPNDIATVQQTINSISKEQLISVGVDESAVKGYTSTTAEKDGVTKFNVDSSEVDAYNPEDKNAKVRYSPDLTAVYRANANITDIQRTIYYNTEIVGSVPSGTTTTTAKSGKAHVNGTAYAHGNWGTKDSGVALGGELGEEIVVHGGHWQTIGENGAEFFKYQRGDIIFNADQTENLLKYGKITSGNKRGSAYAEGTAFSNGSGGFSRKVKSKSSAKKESNSSEKSSSSGKSSSSNSSNDSTKEVEQEEDKFEETLDWIEIMIKRIQSAISALDNQIGNVYRRWGYRNADIKRELGLVSDEIGIQQAGYERYMKQANSVGLSGDWARKVREGKIDIETITNEDLSNKIKDYQNWYEKAIECRDAIADLKEKEAELYKNSFDNISSEFDYYTSHVESLKNHIQSLISQEQSKGYIVSASYYERLMGEEQSNLTLLKAQRSEMQAAFDEAMDSGKIQKYSEAWFQMRQSIDEVNAAIDKSNESTLEYIKNIRQLKWDTNDLIHNTISDLSDESDYLINLMKDKKLYDDRGQLTNYGDTTMGLHVANYDIYYGSAQKYANEIKELDKQIEKDGSNKDLIDRRKELIELQQESILAAQDEKQAIVDMVKEGIQLELDYLQDLIDKYEDALDSQKDLYDYQQKISSHTSEISTLEKQLMAYQGDNSEETKATIQKLKVSLEEAKQDLKDTEYDRYISDQKDLLDEIYNEYEDILNARLDNIDNLMLDMIENANNNTQIISDTIKTESEKFGYNISSWFNGIFNDRVIDGGKYKEDKTFSYYEYGNNKKDSIFDSKTGQWGTSVAAMLNLITGYQKMISQREEWLKAFPGKTGKDFNNDLLNYIPILLSDLSDSEREKIIGSLSDIVSDVKENKQSGTSTSSTSSNLLNKSSTSVGNNDIKLLNGEILIPLGNDSGISSLADSSIGAFSLNNIQNIIEDGFLNAIDTYGDANTKQVKNVINGGVDFNVTLPNVSNYEEFKTELQHDKNFEKMIMAMTTDRLFGGSSLAKYKRK